MESSLFELLDRYNKKGNVSFAMPGHKNGRGIPEPLKSGFFNYDVTELEETESMHEPGKVLRNALDETADFYGADESFILVNGSSSGIFTMLMSCCRAGDKVLVNRNCHVSVINACIVLGLTPVFIRHKIIDRLNTADTADLSDAEECLKNETVSAILITSPSYYGFTADIEGFAKIAEKYNIPLLVDEAHGAHFAADGDIFPKTSIVSGADICVQSAHKTLNAANQTAFLHVNKKRVDIERVRKCFSVFQTTSPSYPLIASADLARRELSKNGSDMWGRVHRKCAEFREDFKDIIVSPDREWIGKYDFCDVDECRLVINISKYKMTGFEFSEKLRKDYKIDVEMADLYQLVLIPTPSNTDEDFEILKRAVYEILSRAQKRDNIPEIKAQPNSKSVMNLSDAFYAKGYLCELEKAEGLVSKSMVVPYPPGIPSLIPGEIVTGGMIDYLKTLIDSGAKVHGIVDGRIEVIKDR